MARRIGDPWLSVRSQRLEGSAMMAAGYADRAKELFGRLCSASEAASDIAWDAATAFHLAGDLERAARWYRRSLGHEGRPFVGRMKYESIEGLVLALGEMGRWHETLPEIYAFVAA